MDQRIRQLRRQVTRCRRAGGRPRYSAEIRAEAVALAAQLSGTGLSHNAIARRFGLNAITLANWKKEQAEAEQQAAAGMLPVAVITSDETAVDLGRPRPVVFGPGGVRVEGLDVDGVAELLRKLS